MLSFSLATRPVAETFVELPKVFEQLLSCVAAVPRRREVVNGVCTALDTISKHLFHKGTLMPSNIVRNAVANEVAVPLFELVARLLSGNCQAERFLSVTVKIKNEKQDPATMPISGQYVPCGMHADRMAWYQPFKPFIINHSDKTMEEHLISPYYLFWDPPGKQWVISPQLGNTSTYVAYANDDVQHPGTIGSLWIQPRKDIARGEIRDYYAPDMSAVLCCSEYTGYLRLLDHFNLLILFQSCVLHAYESMRVTFISDLQVMATSL